MPSHTHKSVCKFWMEGRCKRGDECRFRHSGPGALAATAAAPRAIEGVREEAVPPPLTLLDGNIEVSFAAGLIPTQINFLANGSEPTEQVPARGHRAHLKRVNAGAATAAGVSSTGDCAICWDLSENLVHIDGCRHSACKDCFTEYCTIERDGKSPLRCFTEGCNLHLEMKQLHTNLKKSAYNKLLLEALRDHFIRHPQEFAKCVNQECSAYYRLSEAEEYHTCPKCCTQNCINCRVEYHFGETCEEYQDKDILNERLLLGWIEKQGAKHCKNCNAIVQKLEGCNNMQCHFCQAHFCWVCLEILPTHQEVYAHLLEVHGSYVGEAPQVGRVLMPDEEGLDDFDLDIMGDMNRQVVEEEDPFERAMAMERRNDMLRRLRGW